MTKKVWVDEVKEIPKEAWQKVVADMATEHERNAINRTLDMNKKPRTPAQRKADQRARLREKKLILQEVWIHPDHKDRLKRSVARMQKPAK